MIRTHQYEATIESLTVIGTRIKDREDTVEFIRGSNALEVLAGAKESGEIDSVEDLKRIGLVSPVKVVTIHYAGYVEDIPNNTNLGDRMETMIRLNWEDFKSLGKPYILIIKDSYKIEAGNKIKRS